MVRVVLVGLVGLEIGDWGLGGGGGGGGFVVFLEMCESREGWMDGWMNNNQIKKTSRTWNTQLAIPNSRARIARQC